MELKVRTADSSEIPWLLIERRWKLEVEEVDPRVNLMNGCLVMDATSPKASWLVPQMYIYIACTFEDLHSGPEKKNPPRRSRL